MTHKWDYEPNPWNSAWEDAPYWLRWPLAAIAIALAIIMLTLPMMLR